MTRHGIELDSALVSEFCRKWRIRRLSVFGSVLRGDFRPDSDVDFMAEFDDEADWDVLDLLDARDELSAIVGRDVDLVERVGVEASRNRFRRDEILSTVEPVYAP